MASLFWLSVLGIGYAYFGYAMVLQVLCAFKGRRVSLASAPVPKTVSVIIAARNEEAVIADKLRNTLEATHAALGQGAELAEVLVASDCSDDGTDGIVIGFQTQGVKLIRTTERGGKEKAQKEALAVAHGEIVIFTDAKVQMRRDAVIQFLEKFQDASVGAVSSVDRVESATSKEENSHGNVTSSGEGFYVRYEMWLRELETAFGSLVGLSGSCFAVRKSVTTNWRDDVPSDFASLIETVRLGMRGISAPEIVCTYTAVSSEEEEFGRKVRTVLRGITTFMKFPDVLDPTKFHAFSFQIFSHKLMRWLVPWLYLVALVTGGATHDSLGRLVWFGLVAIGVLALIAFVRTEYRQQTLFKIPLFLCVSNAAIFVAWLQYFSGQRSVMWTPSAKQ